LYENLGDDRYCQTQFIAMSSPVQINRATGYSIGASDPAGEKMLPI
jgi:hypothetical protein